MNDEPDVNDVIRILADQISQLTVELALERAKNIKLRSAVKPTET